MANIVTAKLIKKSSDDGLFNMHVPIGKEYLIDLDTLNVRDGYNMKKDIRWTKEIVEMVNETGGFEGLIPTELIEWDMKLLL